MNSNVILPKQHYIIYLSARNWFLEFNIKIVLNKLQLMIKEHYCGDQYGGNYVSENLSLVH